STVDRRHPRTWRLPRSCRSPRPCRSASAPAGPAAIPSASAVAPSAATETLAAPVESAARAAGAPRGSGGALISRPAAVLLGIERLDAIGIIKGVPGAVVVALPAAARIPINVAITIRVVVAIHAGVAAALPAGSRHLPPPRGVLAAAICIAIRGGATPSAHPRVWVVRRAPSAIGVVAGVHVLHRAPLAGRGPPGHRVVGVADLRAPRVTRPRVVSARGARDRAGGSPLMVDVPGGGGPASRSPHRGRAVRAPVRAAVGAVVGVRGVVGHGAPVRRGTVAPAAARRAGDGGAEGHTP